MKLYNNYIYIGLLALLIIIDASIGGAIAYWREFYWDAIQHLNYSRWIILIIIFSLLALISCFVSGLIQYLSNIISLFLRTKLTKKAIALNSFKEYEGGQQRVQEDCKNYPQLLVSLLVGLSQAILLLIIFTILILYQLPVTFLWVPLIYVFLGTTIAWYIAHPLINLNYINQVLEAKFRQFITKLHYRKVHRNNFNLFKRSKYLQYFQSFYNQITVIFPHLVLSSLLFSLTITFGVFMQLASALSEIVNNLSFLLNSFGNINLFLSCRKRLKEMKII